MTLETRTETATGPNGETVELATIIHEGREFTAMGAMVDTSRGIVCAYVSERDGRYTLTTWEGQTIAPLTLSGSWLNRNVFGGFPVRMFAWKATIDGRTYSGRNAGPAMFVRMRAKGGTSSH